MSDKTGEVLESDWVHATVSAAWRAWPLTFSDVLKLSQDVYAAGREQGRASAYDELLAAMRLVARNALDWSWISRIEAFARARGGKEPK